METIHTYDIRSAVVNAVSEVFDLMLSLEIEHLAALSQSHPYGEKMSAAIKLVGSVADMVTIQVDAAFARILAGNMLDDIEEVKVVVGEVCNLVAGNLKSSLCDAGFNCRISPPTFTQGSDFELECRHPDRKETYVYSHATETFRVAVGFKAAE